MLREKPKLIVGIPAYNEEKRIGEVIKKVKKYTDWIYVFDDGSKDRTSEIAINNGVSVIPNPCNLGKGSTVRYAIRWFLDNKILNIKDILIFIDADGQHNADLIPVFIKTIKKRGVDLVVGKRDLSDYPFNKKIGNWFLNNLSSLLSGLKIEDSESGFRAFNYQMALDIIRFSSARRYGIEIETNIICGRKGGKLAYISIPSFYAGNKGTKIKDGLMNAISGIICWGKIVLEKK
jgi:glycosyltransferase involved in cell wall biosynthesis